MAHTDPNSIKIVDESTGSNKRYQLYVDGQQRAVLTETQGRLHFNWQVYGPQSWPEARNLLLGLLELGTYADMLQGAAK